MAINPADWPIDPYTVDGVELAERLNAVIPSEFDALNSNKANLTGGNSWSGTQNFGAAASARITGDFSNGTDAQRTLFQTNVANAVTRLGIIPNGTATSASVMVYSTSDAVNSLRGYITAAATGVTITADGIGTNSAAFPELRLAQGTRVGLQLETNGVTTVINTVGTANGVLVQSNSAGTVTRRTTVTAGGDLQFIGSAGATLLESLASGTIRVGGAVIGSATTTAAGSWSIVRTRDSVPNRIVSLTEDELGIAVQLAYLPALGATFQPKTDASTYLGWGLQRWHSVYATNGTIQTSDAREKSGVRQFNENEIACAEALVDEIGLFQWLADVSSLGDKARWQVGMTAQRVDQVFKRFSLNTHAYGIVLWEEYPATTEELDEAGNVIREARPYKDRWSAVYTQLNQFMLRGMREKQKRIEARLAALEAKQ